MPIVAVELLNGVAGVFRRLENDNAGALRSTIRAEMDISANNAACTSWRREHGQHTGLHTAQMSMSTYQPVGKGLSDPASPH
jgi:hypothetical protein